MCQCRKGVDRLTIKQNVELCKTRRTEAIEMIVERSVSLAYRLQLVVEVDDDFAQRKHEVQLNTIATNVFLIDKFTTLVETERHNRTDKVGGCDDC